MVKMFFFFVLFKKKKKKPYTLFDTRMCKKPFSVLTLYHNNSS